MWLKYLIVELLAAFSIINSALLEEECPVCFRVVRAAKKLSTTGKKTAGEALEDYCKLEALPVDELKFCYDIDNFKQSLMKLLDYGADEARICNRVHSTNSNFCSVKKKKEVLPGTRARKNARGVIYE